MKCAFYVPAVLRPSQGVLGYVNDEVVEHGNTTKCPSPGRLRMKRIHVTAILLSTTLFVHSSSSRVQVSSRVFDRNLNDWLKGIAAYSVTIRRAVHVCSGIFVRHATSRFNFTAAYSVPHSNSHI